MSWLEEFWGDILSEEPLRITAAWVTLDSESQRAVSAHLRRMAEEEGWQESQRQAAQAALHVLSDPTGEADEADQGDGGPADPAADESALPG